MIKKIFLKIFLILSIIFWLFVFNSQEIYSAWCEYTNWTTIWDFLGKCKPESVAWKPNDTYEVEKWFKDLVNNWIKNISAVLWIIAVWSLVYSWLLLQFSFWHDEQIKKAKNIFKWTLIWFLCLISASWIIYIVVNLIYGLTE